MRTIIGKFNSIKISICNLIKCEIYILTRYVAYKKQRQLSVSFDKYWVGVK